IGRYSVYIIDEVHMLSQAAFNAFLKTLEEPPEYAIFILATTEKHKILPTILSRCQTYDFNRIRVEDIVRNLKDIAAQENVSISDDALHIIAQKADGAMRDSLTLFDQTVAFCGGDITYEKVIGILNVLDYEYYFRLTDLLLAGDFAAALVLFDEILSKGFDALHFISGLSSHLRDLIVCRMSSSRSLLEMAPTIAAKYDEYGSKCSMDFLYKALEISTAAETAYKASGNPRLLIEFALIKMSRIMVTPAAQPAPAVAAPSVMPAAPQPKPQARPSTGASIRSLLSKVGSAESAPAEKAEETPVKVPETITEDLFKAGWQKFLEMIGTPNLRAALSANTPIYSAENNTVTQFVASELQKNWIMEKRLLQLQADLQRALGVKGVRLAIEVQPQAAEPEEEKPYMPTEMAKAMMKDSQQVSDFAREFELEVS
ncbi:MAG: DNA polymerase III subunit gamma/tau, partial [Bacteroidales bacterium]|nr:DNA polymerase III subunit gamma/tau [Bacteroidales bacterium]